MGNERYKTLLIEDDKLDQMAFERLVKDKGLSYDYTIVSSVSEAKSLLATERFDVVIADHELGDGDAFDVLDSVKDIPTIIVTGTGNEEVAVRAWRAGAYDYLTKDIDRNYLKVVPITIENAIKQKKTTEEIRRLSRAIEQSPSTVVITDIKGGIEYVNPKFTQLTGYTLEEVKGENLHVLGAGNYPQELYEKLWATITSGQEWRGEFYNKKKDGGFYWESASISAITNSKGTITSFLKVAEDITSRKKTEEQLRKAEERYRMQFEGALDAIFVTEAETGIIVDCNPAATRLVGREKSELIGQHQRILHAPEEMDGEFSKTYRRHLGENHGQTLETQVVTKTGERKDVAIKANLFEVGGKRVMQGIFRDITKRKRAEEELKETMEIKSQFISTVSHELRTPLTSMKEAITIVSEEVSGKLNKDQKHFLDIAKRNVDRLSRLLNEVLDFQKLSANKMEFQMEGRDIGEAIKEAYSTMTSYADKKGVNFSVEIDGDLPKVRFDSDAIIQVLTNLISNAIKFTPEDGRVSICAKQQDENLVIRVSDTGIGVSKEVLPKIFEQFYQISQNGKQVIKGTGLGLAIVRKIVEAHNGRVEVESEVGQGTTFTVFLPLDGKPKPEVLSEKTDGFLENTVADSQAHTE